MRKSIIKKYRFFCMLSGILMGCIFPEFAKLFMIPKSVQADRIFFVACVLAGISVGLISFTIGKKTVVATFLKLNETFSKMSTGDFTHQCEIQSQDTIGEIVSGIETMKNSLKFLIFTVKDQAVSIDEVVEQYKNVLKEHVSQVENVLQSADLVSEDMREITKVIQSLEQSFININEEAQNLAEKSCEDYGKAEGMAQNAAKAKNEMQSSLLNTDQMIVKANQKMDAAMESMMVINEVNTLLDEIMRISKKTNLLALNASIEANRSDSNGKGFSVIAQEVRQLSGDTSKNTKLITEVMSKVNSSVEELLSNVRELMNYLNTDIRSDYNKFENIISEYENNANYIKDLIMGFSHMSEEISTATKDVTERMGDISTLSMNNKMRADNILEQMEVVVEESGLLLSETDKLNNNSRVLKSTINKFRLRNSD